MNIQVTEPDEIAAVKAGEVVGDEYNDGTVWADEHSLLRWMARPKNVEAETAYVAQ